MKPRGRQARTLIVADRRAKVVALRLDGKTVMEIAAELKVSPSTVWDDLRKAIGQLNDLTVEQTRLLRQRQLDQIVTVRHEIWAERKKKIPDLCKLWEREAKLAGLDAAIVLQHQGSGGGPIRIADARAEVLRKVAAIAERVDLEGDADAEPVAG